MATNILSLLLQQPPRRSSPTTVADLSRAFAVAMKNGRRARESKPRKMAKVDVSKTQSVDQQGEEKPKTTRGKRGMLANLPDLPLDVLFEIFAHLGPYDLLKLTRTSKEYRQLLLNRSCILVWKTALANVPDLPPCPDDMSEPAYANLAFSPHCDSCLSHAKNVRWILRVRYCSKCAQEELQVGCIGNVTSTRLSSDAKAELKKLDLQNLVPYTLTKKFDIAILQSDLDNFAKEYFATPEERRDLFIIKRKKYIKKRYKHASLCVAWASNQVADRSLELQRMREDRKAAIIKKLQGLGLGDDVRSIRYPDSLAAHKLVDKPQRLTPRVWANIKEEILEFMSEMREKRLKRELDAAVFQRKLIAIDLLIDFRRANMDKDALMPSPADFCEFGSIRQILHQPVGVPVNRQSFDDVVARLPALVDGWHTSLRGSLHDIINSDLPGVDATKALQLATTVFVCSNCDDGELGLASVAPADISPLFYPQVQGHKCLSLRTLSRYDRHARSIDPSLRTAGFFRERVPWDATVLSVDIRGQAVARRLVESVGLDVDTTTSLEMDALDLRFYCQVCAGYRFPAYDYLLSWRAAVQHFCHKHSENRNPISKTFKKIRYQDLPGSVVAREQDHNSKCHIWECLHCLDTPDECHPMSKVELKTHLRYRHAKNTEPIEHEDYRQHFAALDYTHISSIAAPVTFQDGQVELLDSSKLVEDDSDSTMILDDEVSD